MGTAPAGAGTPGPLPGMGLRSALEERRMPGKGAGSLEKPAKPWFPVVDVESLSLES